MQKHTEPIPWERIESLLHRVRRPGRYVGGEYNAVHKPWDTTGVHVCLAFPDVYDLGMSNFALAILYDVLNRQPDVLAERTYLPAPDMIAELRAADLPLYSLEGYRPVASFDLLGISTAYEQLYTNALELLDLAGLPIRADRRDEGHPLVIGGGHGTFNPEPIADFFDAFVIGEAEEVIVEIVEALRAHGDPSRGALLRTLAKLDGVYVPRFYTVHYAPSGQVAGVEPTVPEAPPVVKKRIAAEMPPTPIAQLVPNIEIVHDRGVVEIQRGCTRGCRFCQAGTITRPVRERSAADIAADVERIVDATGYEEVAFLSLSSADHSEIAPLLDHLQERFADRQLGFSLPSLRIDAFSVDLADGLRGSRKSGFTFAPEAGTDRLRRRINKEVTNEELLEVATEVFKRGWRTLKLYFMIGLPGETDEDVAAIADLSRQVRAIARRVGGRKTEVHVSVSTFVPKPQTVFQWEPLVDEETLLKRQSYLQRNIRGRGLRLSWNDYIETQLEALLTRGDRRLNAVIETAWRNGARFDAWDEWWRMEAWQTAFKEHQVDPQFYLYRRRDRDETLPWDHLHSGVEKAFLKQDFERSQEGEFLSDCRGQCHGCGILANYPRQCTDEWQCPVIA
jgi:radical SAM family uncharacterized protein